MINKKIKLAMSTSVIAAFLLTGCTAIQPLNDTSSNRIESSFPVDEVLEVEHVAIKKTANITYYAKSNLNGRTKASTGKVKKTYKKGVRIITNGTTKVKGITWVKDKSNGLWIATSNLTKTKPKPQVSPPKKAVAKKPVAKKAVAKKPVAKKATKVQTIDSKAKAILAKNSCAGTPILWNDKRITGIANGAYDFNTHKMLLRSNMPSDRFNYVVTHECMHKVQYRAFKSDYWGMKKRLDQIYGGRNGLEQAADCMTRAKGVTNVWHYTKNCSGYRGTAAKMMIQGKRP